MCLSVGAVVVVVLFLFLTPLFPGNLNNILKKGKIKLDAQVTGI